MLLFKVFLLKEGAGSASVLFRESTTFCSCQSLLLTGFFQCLLFGECTRAGDLGALCPSESRADFLVEQEAEQLLVYPWFSE